MLTETSQKMSINRFNLSWKLLIFGILYIIAVNDGLVDGAIRSVNLVIEPPTVRRSHHASLRCTYDLADAQLYTVKFYRGQYEFYRYTPGELPSTKVFPFPGIYVDISMSNASQVVIRNIQFALSGNFSCEVTADAPFFSTATAYVNMQVVELPEKRPFLYTDQDRYEPGDILLANCTTPPSRPKAILKFTLNNMVVSGLTETQYNKTEDNLFISTLSLKIRLQPNHFIASSFSSGMSSQNFGDHIMNFISPSSSHNSANVGTLMLRCTAQIPDFYQESTDLELGGPQKDPIPARVTSSSSSRPQLYQNIYPVLVSILLSAFIGTIHSQPQQFIINKS